MNKSEFLLTYYKFINEFKLDQNVVVIGAGAALMLLGLRKTINDIDVAIPKNEFDTICKKYKMVIYDVVETTGIRKAKVIPNILGNIDVHIETNFGDTILIDNIRIYTPKRLLLQKQLMNREKDQKDIVNLERLIKQKPPAYISWS